MASAFVYGRSNKKMKTKTNCKAGVVPLDGSFTVKGTFRLERVVSR